MTGSLQVASGGGGEGSLRLGIALRKSLRGGSLFFASYTEETSVEGRGHRLPARKGELRTAKIAFANARMGIKKEWE